MLADGSASEALAALERLALAAPSHAEQPPTAPSIAASDEYAPPSKKPHRAGQPPPGGECGGIVDHVMSHITLQYVT